MLAVPARKPDSRYKADWTHTHTHTHSKDKRFHKKSIGEYGRGAKTNFETRTRLTL